MTKSTLTLLVLTLACAGAVSAQDTEEQPAEQPAPEQAATPSEGDEGAGQALGSAQAPESEAAPQSTASSEEAASSDEHETEEEELAEEESEPEELLPWRNTFLSATVGANFNTFVRDAQLSYNPTVNTFLSISPRWYFQPTTFLWSNFQIFYEFTDSDGVALNHDLQVSDPQFELRQLIPWEGFMFMLQGRIGLPLSKASQVLQRYVQLGLGTTITRPISEANLTLAGLFRYQRWLAGSNVPRGGGPLPIDCYSAVPRAAPGDLAPTDAFIGCDQLGGVTGTRDTILAGLAVTWVPLAGLSFFGQFVFFNTYGFELAPAYINVDTSQDPIQIDDGSPTHWRNFTYFTVAVAYDILPWFNLALGFQNSANVAPAWNADGSVRSIFNPDSQVYLSATFQIDAIYTDLFGTHHHELTPEERQRRRQGLASGPSNGGSF